MAISVIIISLIVGFVAGTVGALVAVEAKTEIIRKEVDDAVLGLKMTRSEAKKAQEASAAVNTALQQMILQFKRDRGAIWESLNGLWNDYDARNAKTSEEPKKTKTEPAKTAKPARKTTKKASETKEKTKNDAGK